MVFTPKIQKAIHFSVRVHQMDQDQRRKIKSTPYITHPISVGLILARVGAEEDIVVAGILHDTVEDSHKDKKVTVKEIEKEFGGNVARMVGDVTEDKNLPWLERKRKALEHISHMQKDSQLVKSADVLHNITDYIHDYKVFGSEKVLQTFTASKEFQFKLFENRIKALDDIWKENPLLQDLKVELEELKKLFGAT